jgi:DNA (cytosine-5)-methyltransferase 1
MSSLAAVISKKQNSAEKSVSTFKLGELFCGPGGLGLGAIRAKAEKDGAEYTIKHEWASDYDLDSCKTYVRNISRTQNSVLCQDVRTLKIEDLPHIDAFAYGFPCNDFSLVGKQKGFNGEFGPLYTYGVKVLNYFKPKFFIAENVGGIASANDGKAFERILFDLEEAGCGYNLTPHLYKSEEYGIPQTRHRMIIVGIDKRLHLRFNIPVPTTAGTPKTAKEALENPPIPPHAANQELTKQSSLVAERLRHIKPGRNVWDTDLPKHLKLNVKGAKLSQIYKRLHPDLPAYTITGSGGGGTHGYHWDEPRALTNRERARIQTFPDNFTFIGSKESVRKQIGMAVPPKLSEQIFRAVLKTFAVARYFPAASYLAGQDMLRSFNMESAK